MRFIRTTHDFGALIRLGETSESLELEFKQDLDRWRSSSSAERRDGQKEACRDISQFANTDGGCLLIGVAESRTGTARVAESVPGIDDFDGRRQWLQQAVQNFLVPSTFSMDIVPIDIDGKVVLAVNVPAHEHLVSLWDRQQGTIECIARTSHGKRALNPDEVESHLMNTNRTARLAFQRIVSAMPTAKTVELASGVWTMVQRPPVRAQSIERLVNFEVLLDELGDHDFTLLLPKGATPPGVEGAPKVKIPYGLIREVWRTSQGTIGILLHVRLIHFGGTSWLEPH